MKKYLFAILVALFVLTMQAQEAQQGEKWVSLTEFQGKMFLKLKSGGTEEINFFFDEMPVKKIRFTKKKGDFYVRFSDMPGGDTKLIVRRKHVLNRASDGIGFIEYKKLRELESDKNWYMYESKMPVYLELINHLKENDVQVCLSDIEIELLREMKSFYIERCKNVVDNSTNTSESLNSFVEYWRNKTGNYPVFPCQLSKVKTYATAHFASSNNERLDDYNLNKLSENVFAYKKVNTNSSAPAAKQKPMVLTTEDKIRQFDKKNPRKPLEIKPRPETEQGWTLVKSNKFADQDIVCEHWRKGYDALCIFKKSNGDFATFAENEMQLTPSEDSRSIGEYRRTLSDKDVSIILYGGFIEEVLELESDGDEREKIKLKNDNGTKKCIFRIAFPNGVVVDKIATSADLDYRLSEGGITWYEFVNGYSKFYYNEAEQWGHKTTAKKEEYARKKTTDWAIGKFNGFFGAHAAYDKNGVKYYIAGPSETNDQEYAIDIETGNTYRLVFHRQKNYSYDEVAIETYPKMKLWGNSLYFVSEHDSIIAVEDNVVKYANGDYLEYNNKGGLAGQLHRNGGIAKIDMMPNRNGGHDYVVAEINYPDGKTFRGYIAKLYENGEYSIITDGMYKRWLCDNNITPYKGTMEMSDGTVVQIEDGMTLAEKKAAEAEKERRKLEAERKNKAAQQKVVDYYKKKYGYYPGDDFAYNSVYKLFSVGRPIAAIIEYSKSINMPVPELIGNWGSVKKYRYTYYDILNNRHTMIVYTRNGVISSVYR